MYSFIALVQQACITYRYIMTDVRGTNGFVWLQCWYHLQVVTHVCISSYTRVTEHTCIKSVKVFADNMLWMFI